LTGTTGISFQRHFYPEKSMLTTWFSCPMAAGLPGLLSMKWHLLCFFLTHFTFFAGNENILPTYTNTFKTDYSYKS
jgi:hypothetical protein